MFRKKSGMLLGLLIGLPTLLLLFLFLKRRRVTNLPPSFKSAMQKAFSKNPTYKSYQSFWSAVAKMETAAFTSRLYTEYNNPWGMKIPKERKTTALKGEAADGIAGRDSESMIGMFQSMKNLENFLKGSLRRADWAVYPNLDAAAEDIILWMTARKFKPGIVSLKSFVDEMDRLGYFGSESATSYLNKVIAWEQR